MDSELIHDRGRGPEIVGTRITVYNLLPYFLDPTATEAMLCRLYELTPEQVSAARAYVLNHADTVLAEHLQIERRMAAGNSAQDIARAQQTHAAFLKFKDWLAQREAGGATSSRSNGSGAAGPTFREWLAEQESRTSQGS
jgi:uncharacterized protein (DUF433 family)